MTPPLFFEHGPRAACAFLSRLALATLVLLLSLAPAPAPARQSTVPPDSFVALSYHEIDDDLNPRDSNAIGRYGMESSALVAQFAWLRDNGYTPVSLSAVIEARNGGKPLPAKSVLLTFDDGYASFYHRVFPVLRLFGYPSVIALVGKWMDTPDGMDIDYEGHPVSRDAFMSWRQVREMVRSGLVEVASHSYDLHHGVPGNPQGNMLPAATTRIHDAGSGRYEDDAAYEARIRADLQRSSAQIEREIGQRPRAIVWPYGRYNGATQKIARALGMPVMMTVESGVNTPSVPLDAVNRSIVQFNPDLNAFVDEIETVWPADPRRVVHVDLDRVHDASPEERERKLSLIIERIVEIRPNTVFLKAWSDTDGDGRADHLYFPNRHLPVRSDLFNRVAWQLATLCRGLRLRSTAGRRIRAGQRARAGRDRHGHLRGSRAVHLFFRDRVPGARRPSGSRQRRVCRTHPYTARTRPCASGTLVRRARLLRRRRLGGRARCTHQTTCEGLRLRVAAAAARGACDEWSRPDVRSECSGTRGRRTRARRAQGNRRDCRTRPGSVGVRLRRIARACAAQSRTGGCPQPRVRPRRCRGRPAAPTTGDPAVLAARFAAQVNRAAEPS